VADRLEQNVWAILMGARNPADPLQDLVSFGDAVLAAANAGWTLQALEQELRSRGATTSVPQLSRARRSALLHRDQDLLAWTKLTPSKVFLLLPLDQPLLLEVLRLNEVNDWSVRALEGAIRRLAAAPPRRGRTRKKALRITVDSSSRPVRAHPRASTASSTRPTSSWADCTGPSTNSRPGSGVVSGALRGEADGTRAARDESRRHQSGEGRPSSNLCRRSRCEGTDRRSEGVTSGGKVRPCGRSCRS
jgi:hypothetical protein